VWRLDAAVGIQLRQAVPLFTLGHPSIWLFCLDWNEGNDQPPSVLIMDDNIVRNDQVSERKNVEQLLAAIRELQAVDQIQTT